MLNLLEHNGTERPNPLTTFKLFEGNNTMEPSYSIPKASNKAISRSCKKVRWNENANEDVDHGTGDTATQLLPLPADHRLLHAISQVRIPMDRWETPDIFRLFLVLVDPPQGLDLSAIGDLPGYLNKLQAWMRIRIENGIREIVCHCWLALLSRCSTPNLSHI